MSADRNDAGPFATFSAFSVATAITVDAARAAGMEFDGAGWLFGIERIDEAALQDLLCYTDLSGTEVFAKDGQGRYYLYCHPTDVRYVRENNVAMAADQARPYPAFRSRIPKPVPSTI